MPKEIRVKISHWLTGPEYPEDLFHYYTKPLPGLTEPWIVEITGTSGVGKTTLLKALRQHGQIKSFVFKSKIHKPCASPSQMLCHENIFRQKVHYTAPGIHSLNYLHTLLKMHCLELEMRNHLAPNQIGLFDEGFSHHYTPILIKAASEKPELLQQFMQQRALVHLTGNAEMITGRISQRHKIKGVLHIHHQGKNMEELTVLNRHRNDSFEQLMSVLAPFGVPILEVDAAQPLEQQIISVIGFLHSLNYRQGVHSIDQQAPSTGHIERLTDNHNDKLSNKTISNSKGA